MGFVMSEQLREICLYGHLGKKFGRIQWFAVESAQEAIMAMCMVLDGFERELMAHADGYLVFAGKKDKDGLLSEKMIGVKLSAHESVYIVPVVQGSNWFSDMVHGATDIFMKVTMLGWINKPVADAVKPKIPSVSTPGQAPESIPSFAFGSIANYTDQGVAVPIVYGEVIAGSVVASQGLSAVELVI
jgi:predicted phage tail protein